MSVQGLVNQALGTTAGAVSKPDDEVKKKLQEANLEGRLKQNEILDMRISKMKAAEAARKAASEQVATMSRNNTMAKQTLSERKIAVSQENAADAIRQLREAGYISGRQAKRAIYNATRPQEVEEVADNVIENP